MMNYNSLNPKVRTTNTKYLLSDEAFRKASLHYQVNIKMN